MLIASSSATVAQGSMLIALLLALAAGLVSFLSPCVLPLLPGYLSFLGGSAGAQAAAGGSKHRIGRTVLGAFAFVAGFTVVFVSYGALFGGLGSALHAHQRVLSVIFGSITIVLGLFFAGLLPGANLLNREVRVHWLPRATILGAGLLGILFSLGWTPCIGPTLGAILGLAASSTGTSALRGSLLAVAYCIGLGIPFVLAALATEKVSVISAAVRRHAGILMRVGGIALVAVGIMEVTGLWGSLLVSIQDQIGSFSPSL